MNPSLDVSTGTNELEPAKKLRCETPVSAAGGGGVNVARVAKRFGHPVTAVMPIGGPNGQLLLSLLADEGIPTHAVPIAGDTRQSLMVAERSQEQQFRFVFPGPDMTGDEADLVRSGLSDLVATERAAPAVDRAVVVISGSLPPGVSVDFLADLANDLSDRGALVVGDGSGEPLAALSKARIELLKPSNSELAALTGLPLTTDAELEAAAREIVNAGGTRAVLVSLGPTGAILVERDQPTRRLRPPTVEAVSTVGAGDSMVAATAVSLAEGASLTDAAIRGVAAGTAAVLTPGSELCHPADVDRLAPQVRIS